MIELFVEIGPFCWIEYALEAGSYPQFIFRVALFFLLSLPSFLFLALPWMLWKALTEDTP